MMALLRQTDSLRVHGEHDAKSGLAAQHALVGFIDSVQWKHFVH
jgi:hypothetical protein